MAKCLTKARPGWKRGKRHTSKRLLLYLPMACLSSTATLGTVVFRLGPILGQTEALLTTLGRNFLLAGLTMISCLKRAAATFWKIEEGISTLHGLPFFLPPVSSASAYEA